VEPTYDFEWWRALVTVVFLAIIGIWAISSIFAADSSKGKWGGWLTTKGILLVILCTWFFTSVLQPIVISQYMRTLNPWQVQLLDQPATPRIDNSKAEYDIFFPAVPDVGEKWYMWVEYTQEDARNGIPLSKNRGANSQFWYSDSQTTSRTQLVP